MRDIFNLLIDYLINTLLFVRIKQISKSRSPKAAIQSVPRERIKKHGKSLKKNCGRVRFLVKL